MKVVHLGRAEYPATLQAMREFNAARLPETEDELWLVEHAPVFTLGQAGKREHLLDPHGIAVVQTDRGGQVTYHGPGQVIAYPLLDLKRLGIYVKEYVHRMELAIICTLADAGVAGRRVAGAPGIYVALDGAAPVTGPVQDRFAGLAKIAALGVKISGGKSSHGLALNVAMDLTPFGYINPCGYAGLQTIDMATLGVKFSWEHAAARLSHHLQRVFVR